MQPDKSDYDEWLTHPVTEWVLGCMRKMAAGQQAAWSELAWQGDLNPQLHTEARVRADCYLAVPDSAFEDWKAIDDSED